MPPSFRCVSSVLAGLAALAATPGALGTPTISFTPGAFPATGSPAGVVSTPAGLVISVTAAPTAGASIVSVVVSVNGTNIGTATGTSPFTVPWFPSVAGTYSISATATDTSANTTGAGASVNNATANSVVTLSAARSAQILAPASGGSLVLGSRVFLRSSAALSDGVVRQVQFVLDAGTAGESVLATATQLPYNVSYLAAGVAPGAHTITARATANSGGGDATFDSPSVNFNVVSAVGLPPTVTVAAPAAGAYLAASTAVTLTATAADPDGFIPSSAGGGVTFFADGEPVGTDLTAPYSVTWTPSVAKLYSLVAQAVDDRGNVGQSPAVTVTAVASLPTITVSAPATATAGTAATLTAAATASTGATVTSVQFLVNGIALGGALNATPYSAAWTPSVLGNNAVTARVTDSSGIIAISAPANVTVSTASGTAVSLLAPTNGATLPQGSQVFLRSTAAIAGSIVSRVDYYLDQVAIPVASVARAPYNVAYTVTAAPGAHTLFARAVASDGATVDSATVDFTVVPPVGVAPTVSLTAPASGAFVATGSSVSLTAVAADADGFISPNAGGGVTFFADGDPIGSDLVAPYTTTWTPAVAKAYSLRAQTVDDKGNVTLSAPVTVTALAALPTVALVSPPSVATVGAPVTLTATANASPGASVTSVVFLANGTPIGAPAVVSPYVVSWTPAASGSFSLTAQVTDSTGATLTAAASSVTVGAAAASVTLIAPTNGAVVAVGTPIDVTATAAASAPGASVASVQFLAGTTVIGTVASPVGGQYRVKWTPSAGNTTLTARVTDTLGSTVTSTGVTVTGVAQTAVTLTAPASASTATLGVPFTLTASASATPGTVVTQVEFFAGATSLGVVPSAPFTLAWTPAAVGTFAIKARVTDSAGTTAETAAVNVTVGQSPSAFVAVTSPVPGAVVTVGVPTDVTATATAPTPGAIVRQVQFLAGTSVIGTVTVPVGGVYAVKWTPTAGDTTLTARVTDTLGASATSSGVTVTGVVATSVSLTAPANASAAVVGTAINLTASAAATAGSVITKVEFLAGGVPVGTVTAAPFTLAWTPAAAGATALTARTTDSFGSVVTSAAVNVTVNPAPPTIVITSPTPGNQLGAGTPVPITATVNPGSAGVAITRVQFLAGSTVVSTVAGEPATTSYTGTWTPASAGDFNLSARVTDANGTVVTSATVNVTVITVSTQVVITSPTAGGAQVGTPLVFSASVDAAPGVTVSQVQFLAGSTVVATLPGSAAATSYSTTWTPTAAGSYSLTVRTTDSNGVVRNSPAVQVVAQATTVSLSLLPNNASIPVNSSRVISANASAPAGVASVEFYYVGASRITLIGTDTAPPYTILFTAPNEPGRRVLRARAFDILGGSVDSADFTINITGQIGEPPVLGILTPVSGSFVAANNTTTISGTATDADGSISSIQVFVNGTTAGLGGAGVTSVTNGAWSVSWTPTSSGVASISAIATDNAGNAVAAPAVGVNISDSTSPIINLTLSPRTAAAAASTTLPSGAVRTLVADVVASSGRAVVRVEFFVDGTKVGEDTSAPFTHRYAAPALAAGELSRPYVLSARATDNAGTARDVQVSVLVISPAGAPPTVNLLTPANGASTTPGSAISLAATATSIDSTIASVQFYVNGSPALVNGGNGLTAAPYVTTFLPTLPGSYVIDAIATDARGNTAISSSVTVSAALPVPTIVFTAPNPNATARATPGVPITLAATPSVLGGGAQFLLVEFLLDGVQIGADTTAPYTFSWIPTVAQLGERILTARVIDLNAQVVTTAPLTVNVANVVGSPPTVTVTATPIPGNGLQTASTINFQATAVATGTGSTLRNVEIFLNDVSIGLATREQTTNFYRRAFDLSQFDFSTITPTINENTGAVTYPVRLYAIARDSNNNQTVSPTVNLTIFPATSAPPTIQVQALTPTNITAGTQFFMQANLNDPDGNVSTVQLYANGSLVGNFPNPQQGQLLTYTANTAGRFNLYAVATDETGNTAVSTPSIVINVTAVTAPSTAITRPEDNSTATTVGSPVFLEGTAVNAVTTQVPTLQFIATAAGGARQVINGTRVGTTTSYRAIWTPTNPDTYTITTQASVGNVQGTSTTSRRVVVSDVVGLAPTISLTRSPGVLGYPTSAQTASSADFAATAQDPDGAVVAVEFFLNRFSIGQARRDPQGNTWRLQASFAGLQPGATEIVALARDSSGNVVPSATGSINVTAAASIAPSITITPSTTNPAFNRQVQLRANARDTDGTVTNVQYFANALPITSSTNAGSLFLSNWTPAAEGKYLLWALATDSSGITTVSPTIELNVRRNNPVLENAAFILQTYQDIANTTNINPLVFDDLDERLGSGALSRADFVASLLDQPGFLAPVQFLATYQVLMGRWPTPQDYTNFLAIARGSLSNAVGGVLFANDYFAKYGAVPTTALLNNPASAIPARTFLDRLWANAASSPSTNRETDLVRFMSNNVLSTNIGRGYNVIGVSQAIAEFVVNTNAANTALWNRARAATIFYQLARPPVTVTYEEITARVDALLRLPDTKSIVEAVLKDELYGYRYVTITRHPQSLVVAPRSGAIFSVEAQGAPPLVYQWLLNGAPIPGATSPVLSLTNVDTSRVGTYTAVITSAAGVATSDPATLTLSNVTTRLANISTRGQTSAGANVLIGGFVVNAPAGQTRQMLIRVVGPTLSSAPFNLANTLNNPALALYVGTNQNPVLTNDDWGTQAAGAAQVQAIQQATNRAAAFALQPNSRDAAILATLPAGPYTVQAQIGPGSTNNAGLVLIEVYDVTQGGPAAPKAINVSTRGAVGTGANSLIAGFVVTGQVSRRMLIRGAGPTLANLGVPGVLADPILTLSAQSTGQVLRTNDNWGSGEEAPIIASAASAAGAFPFPAGSRDAAMIVMLPPGAYTVQLAGVGGGTGVGIVEVYDVDP